MTDDRPLTRRSVLAGAGAAAGTVALTACSSGSYSSSPSAGTGSAGGSPTASESGSAGDPAATKPLATLGDIPVGSAVAAKLPNGNPIVVAQPKPGKAAAFSAICTHMGCTVAPAGKKLRCPCHGSVYDASTGKVLKGPAPSPLPPVAVDVKGGAVVPATG